jgi:hypothetical protein
VDREPRCYLCMGLGHYVLACPFLGRDARARALQHREKVFRKEPLPSPRLSSAARSELRLFELTNYFIICHILLPAGFWSFRPILIKFGPVGPLDQIRVHLIKYYFQDRCPEGHGKLSKGW